MAGETIMATDSRPEARPGRSVLCRSLCGLLPGLLLTGCMDTTAQTRKASTTYAVPRENIARRPGVSPRHATVALMGIEGAPDEISTRFSESLERAARTKDITLAERSRAKYFARVYLTATPAEGATTRIAYVQDIFNKSHHRVQRISDEFIMKSTSADPWVTLDNQALQQLADQSATALAAALTNTPEAMTNTTITVETAGTTTRELTKADKAVLTQSARADKDDNVPAGLAAAE